MKKRSLVLASASPQRRKLLKRLGVPFRIIPSGSWEINPSRVSHHQAVELVVQMARRKASAVAKRLQGRRPSFQRGSAASKLPWESGRCAVLGADTLVVCAGRIFGKPKSQKHARAMLRQLSGSWQSVLTGICVILLPEGEIRADCAETRLRFKKIDEPAIARLAKENQDKSGSYAVQDIHDRYIREMRGDLDNVIGLPLRLVRRLLGRSLRRG